MSPTPDTLRLLDKMRTLTNEFGDFAAAVEGVAQGRGMTLRLGAVPQALVTYVPQAIERFRAAGGCALNIQEGTARQLLEQLLAGELDGVIGRLPADGLPPGLSADDLSITPLYRDEVCVVVHPTHPLLKVKRITLLQLAKAQWVLQRPDSSVRRALHEVFLREGLPPPMPVVEMPTYIQNLA
jgi:DNA-binding transcriptional LysR family regulator